MEQTIEAFNDLMKAKEQESFYRSKGEEIPSPASSVSEAKEQLKQAEADMYWKK